MNADTFTTFDSSRSVDNNNNKNNNMCQYQPTDKNKYPERIEYACSTTKGATTKGNRDQSLRQRDSPGREQENLMDEDALVPPGTASTTATTGSQSISAPTSNTSESFDSIGCGTSAQSADPLAQLSTGSSGDGEYYGDTEVNSDNNDGETNSSGSHVEDGFGLIDDEQRETKAEQLVIIGEKASHHEDPSHRRQQSRQSQEQKLNSQQPISLPQQHESTPQESHHQQQSSESTPSISRPLTPRFPQQPQTPRTSRFTMTKAKSFKVRRAPPRSPSLFLTRSHSFDRRPSSAPAAPLSSEPSSKYTAPSHTLRSARYIADQWRSRAVQWGTASKINEGMSARLSTVLPDLPATSGRTIGTKSPSTGSITDSDGEERQDRLERLDVAKQVAKVWKARMDHLTRTDTVSRDLLPDVENSGQPGLTRSFTEESTEDSLSSQKWSSEIEGPESVTSGLTNHSTQTRKTRGGAQRKPELSRITDSFVLKRPASISSDSESSVSSHNSNDDHRCRDMSFTQSSYSLESAYPLDPIESGVETSEPSRQDSSSTCPSLSFEIREEEGDHDEICMANTWPVLEPLELIPLVKKKKKNVSFDSLSLNNEKSDLPQRVNNIPTVKTASSDPQLTNILNNGLQTEEIIARPTLQTTVAATEETKFKIEEAETCGFLRGQAEGISQTDTTSEEMERLKVEISEAADQDQEGEGEAANTKAAADKRMRDAKVAAEEETKARLAREKEAEHLKEEEATRMEYEKEAKIVAEKEAASVKAEEKEMKRIEAEEDAKITVEEEVKAKGVAKETKQIIMEEVARLKTEEEEAMATEKEAIDQVAAKEAARVKAEEYEAACVKKAEEDALIAAEEKANRDNEVRMRNEGESKIFDEEEDKALVSTEEASRINAKEIKAAEIRSEKEAAEEQVKQDEIENEFMIQAQKEAEVATTRLLNVKEGQIVSEIEKMTDAEVSAVEKERIRVLDEARAYVEEKKTIRVSENAEKMNFAATTDVKFLKIENKLESSRPQAKAKLSSSQITKDYGCNNSYTSSSMNMSLRSFLSESTGPLPISRCDSDNSSVYPEDHCNSDLDLFSLQEEKVINVVASGRRRSRKKFDDHQDGGTSLPQHTLITAEQTRTTLLVRNIAPMSSVKRVRRTSQNPLLLSRQCLPQCSSTAIGPLSPQHATVPISTLACSEPHHSRPNFGRKRYGDANISFTFSVITSSIRAPQSGTYALPKRGEESYKENKLHKSSKGIETIRHTTSGILHKIMDRFSIAVRQTRMAGGILMEADCSAFPLSVKCDDAYTPPTRRPGLVRNLVRAAIPIIYVKGDTDGLRSARDSIRFTLRKSILRGDFKGCR